MMVLWSVFGGVLGGVVVGAVMWVVLRIGADAIGWLWSAGRPEFPLRTSSADMHRLKRKMAPIYLTHQELRGDD